MAHPKRIVARVTIALAALAGSYIVAGIAGGMMPVNEGWREPAAGVTIWVEDNGIHTGIVMPKVAAGVDWRADFPARHLADPRYGGWRHVAVGWGEKNFYVGTPTWWDLRPGTVLAAAVGSEDTVLHVEHVPAPRASATVRPVHLRVEEYRRLARAIRQARRSGAPLPGYAAHDLFYPAAGRYSALATCNAWTGTTLAQAGVRVGRWTPFPSGVMRWFGGHPSAGAV